MKKTSNVPVAGSGPDPHLSDTHGYDAFLSRIQNNFITKGKAPTAPLFTTDANDHVVGGLFGVFVSRLPAEGQQHYTCNSCRRFFDRFGGLVHIDPKTGDITSAIWPSNLEQVPPFFREAVLAMLNQISRASVTGVFLSTKKVFGEPKTGEWSHVAIQLKAPYTAPHPLLSAGQRMAEKQEEFKMLNRTLAEFRLPTIENVLKLLDGDALYRSEKVIGPARFLHDLMLKRIAIKASSAKKKDNLVWYATATAPTGYAHIRGGVLGSLMEDLGSSLPQVEVLRRFREKMNPLQYQRPTSAPKAGNVAVAEKLVDKLGIEPSLDRRYAYLEEVYATWKPRTLIGDKAVPTSNDGVFVNVRTRPAARVRTPSRTITLPTKTMTWEKFQREVLPFALNIELRTPTSNAPFVGLLTATNEEAPPILQWDQPDCRNPFSWYFWAGGSHASQWGLSAGTFVKVEAITPHPSAFGTGVGAPNQPPATVFILKGAKDTRTPGVCLFPEILKSELHAVRSTIEAFSKTKSPTGKMSGNANGLAYTKDSTWNVTLKVSTEDGIREYLIDRWD